MFRPIAESTHIAHEIARAWVLVIDDEIANRVVQMKCRRHDNGDNHDAKQPVKNGVALHNKAPVSNSYLALAFALAPNR